MNTENQNPLFSEFITEKLSLKNRIVMAPMTRNKSPNYVPNAEVLAYYRRRAENDVGLIITEGTTINHKAANGDADVPAFHGEALDRWKPIVEAVHLAGGKIAPQLWHVGSVRKPGTGPDPSVPGMGPSGITNGGKKKAETLTIKDIDEIVAAYAQGAADAEALGFDAVELHGAHGYLIDQFFWEGTNQRTDAYGGSMLKRAQFAVEILSAVRGAISDSFPVILRFSQWKQQDFNARLAHTPDELEQFLTPLSEAGVDIFHASTRRFWEPEFPDSGMNLAGWTRAITGKPTITVGSVGLEADFIEAGLGPVGDGLSQTRSLEDLIQRVEDKEFDLVAVGRALLQDPAWVKKVEAGATEELQDFDRKSLATLY